MREFIDGATVIARAALDAGVEKVLALSTDKAVSPANLYGGTKLVAEKLVIQSNNYAAGSATRYACVRYGNVVGSRGSVVPLFIKMRSTGKITITDERMTRFWLSLEQGVHFVIQCIEQMEGGEVFIPKIPSTRVLDLARAIAPEAQIEIIGIRPGEKLHEALVSEDEARHTREFDDMFVIEPAQATWGFREWSGGKPLPQKPFFPPSPPPVRAGGEGGKGGEGVAVLNQHIRHREHLDGLPVVDAAGFVGAGHHTRAAGLAEGRVHRRDPAHRMDLPRAVRTDCHTRAAGRAEFLHHISDGRLLHHRLLGEQLDDLGRRACRLRYRLGDVLGPLRAAGDEHAFGHGGHRIELGVLLDEPAARGTGNAEDAADFGAVAARFQRRRQHHHVHRDASAQAGQRVFHLHVQVAFLFARIERHVADEQDVEQLLLRIRERVGGD